MAIDVVHLAQEYWPLLMAAGLPSLYQKVKSLRHGCFKLEVGGGRVDIQFTTRPPNDD